MRHSVAVIADESATLPGDLLLQAVEGMHRPMFVLDEQWRFRYVNPAGAEVLDRTVEGLTGRDVWAEFPEAVGGPFEALYREVRRTGASGATEAWFGPLGEVVPGRCVPHRCRARRHLRRRHGAAPDRRGADRGGRGPGAGGRGGRLRRSRGGAGGPAPDAAGRHQPGHDLDVRHRRGGAALRRAGRAAAGRLVHRQRARPRRNAPRRRPRAPGPGDGAAHAPVRGPARQHQRRELTRAGVPPRRPAGGPARDHRRDHPLDGAGGGGPRGAGATAAGRGRRLPAARPQRHHRRRHAGQRARAGRTPGTSCGRPRSPPGARLSRSTTPGWRRPSSRSRSGCS